MSVAATIVCVSSFLFLVVILAHATVQALTIPNLGSFCEYDSRPVGVSDVRRKYMVELWGVHRTGWSGCLAGGFIVSLWHLL